MIREKKIKSGKLLEIEFFPVYNNGARILTRSQKEKISKEKQKKLNKKNAEKKLIRKVNANFDEGDLFCHLTYKADNIPQSETQLKKDIKNYILSLKDPEILALYNRFKAWKGIMPGYPCSDEEREEFERYVLGDEKYEKLKGKVE